MLCTGWVDQFEEDEEEVQPPLDRDHQVQVALQQVEDDVRQEPEEVKQYAVTEEEVRDRVPEAQEVFEEEPKKV